MAKIVVANWKMNGSASLANTLTSALKLQSFNVNVKLVVCPPFTLIPLVESKLKHNRDICLGAQDVSAHEEGAYTGEVSGTMLKEAGCSHVIIGHSERRNYHHETPVMILAKVDQAVKAGLVPIVCIGESLDERRQHNTETVLQIQLELILKNFSQKFILAYEPVWAIGTQVAATVKEIQETHAFLRKKLYNCVEVPLLYGGSVNSANAQSILSLPEVDGVLVGGASLKVAEMHAICEAAHLAGAYM